MRKSGSPETAQGGRPITEGAAVTEAAENGFPRGCVTPQPCALVIFGASGDLTHRMLIPALYNLEYDRLLADNFTVVGFSRQEKTDESFRAELRKSVSEAGDAKPFDEEAWKRLAARLHYISGEYDDAASFARLAAFTDECRTEHGCTHFVYYLSVPPNVSETVLDTMKKTRLVVLGTEDVRTRIMLEKPFGMDLESARRLSAILDGMFDESQVYRVDHYLGKDTIRNLLIFRFANAIWEPLWNNKYIDNVQITATEEIGIEGRGGYYDGVGVVRDMVQNHVLQVLSLITMEPPVSGDPDSVRGKKLEILESVAPIAADDACFGQYEGYRDEPRIAKDSCTPTFVAFRLFVNNWRWHGVPFYVRSGKKIARKVTEVAIRFKGVPTCVIDDPFVCRMLEPNVLYIRIQPDEGIKLSFTVKMPGRGDDLSAAEMDFKYSGFGVKLPNAYERIILDCLCGQATHFWRSDEVEAAWRVVEPLLESACRGNPKAFPNYTAGSWGPDAARELLRRDNRRWLSSE